MPTCVVAICLICAVQPPIPSLQEQQIQQLERQMEQLKRRLNNLALQIQAAMNRSDRILAKSVPENELAKQIANQLQKVIATEDLCDKKMAKLELNKLINEYKALRKRNEADSEKK